MDAATEAVTPKPKTKRTKVTKIEVAPPATDPATPKPKVKKIEVAPPAFFDDEPSYEPAKSVYDKISEGFYRSTLPWKAGTDPEAKALRKAHSEDNSRLHALFKSDLFAENGVTDNPKADRAFAIAWDHGHHSGYSDVAGYFDEIVELIKD